MGQAQPWDYFPSKIFRENKSRAKSVLDCAALVCLPVSQKFSAMSASHYLTENAQNQFLILIAVISIAIINLDAPESNPMNFILLHQSQAA